MENTTTLVEKQKRRPRFKRVPRKGKLDLKDEHIAVLRHLRNYRLLRKSHLQKLLHRLSHNQLNAILRDLYDYEYIERPGIQKLWLFLGRGDDGLKDYTYALYNKGDRILREEEALPRGRSDWKKKNEITEMFARHELMVADIMVAIEEACRRRGNIRLIPPDEILRDASPPVRFNPKPFEMRVEFAFENRLHRRRVTPDMFFGLHFLDEPEGQNKAYFLLEADRGTESVFSRNMNKATIFRKYLCYNEIFIKKIHTKNYLIKGFRVIFATTKKRSRVENMTKKNKLLNNGAGSRLFYFSQYHELIVHPASSDILDHPMINGYGETVRMID